MIFRNPKTNSDGKNSEKDMKLPMMETYFLIRIENTDNNFIKLNRNKSVEAFRKKYLTTSQSL